MFWQDREPETGVFCQWFPSVIEDGEFKYNCCEQYMMAAKARLFQVHFRLLALCRCRLMCCRMA